MFLKTTARLACFSMAAVLTGTAMLAAGCRTESSGNAHRAAPATAVTVVEPKTFSRWPRVPDRPIPVDASTWVLCVTTGPVTVKAGTLNSIPAGTSNLAQAWTKNPVPPRSPSANPHTGYSIVVRVSPAAATAYTCGEPMPVGAVVVKEKYADPSASGPLRGYAVMTKRPPGFDREGGDWEYAYVSLDGQRTVASGQALSGCATCHASARSTDFLFRSNQVPATTLPATQPTSAVTAPFDSDPRHLWNRLHCALLVRTAPDGRRAADDLFPYLWGYTRYLLRPPAHDEALRVLDEFIETRGEKLIADPRKRLILQRELWGVFDWSVCAVDGGGLSNADEATATVLRFFESVGIKAGTTKAEESAGIALRGRLATIIPRLALSDRELADLGDNYRAAVQRHAFPADYDPAEPERSFFPADLMDPDSPWLCINAEGQQHAHAVGGRSAFLVFVQLPGGKRATENFLNAYTHGSQLPAGTRLALLRQALAINQAGDVVPTNVTESLQVLVSRGRPHINDPFDVYQFNLDCRAWFGRTHGLRALALDDRSLWIFDRAGPDPFETPTKGLDGEWAEILTFKPSPTLHNCINCHQPLGGASLQSLPSFDKAPSARDHAKVAPTSQAAATELAVQTKTKRKDWEMLHRLFTAEGAGHGRSYPNVVRPAKPPATARAAPPPCPRGHLPLGSTHDLPLGSTHDN